MSSHGAGSYAKAFSFPNAYWLAVASNDVYVEKDTVLKELERWGFKNGDSDESEDHLFFLDQTRELKLEVFGNVFKNII